MKTLEQRSRLLVNCYRALSNICGSERFVEAARILPHFPEPVPVDWIPIFDLFLIIFGA